MNLVTIDTAPGNMSMYIAPNNTSYLQVGSNARTIQIGPVSQSGTTNVSTVINGVRIDSHKTNNNLLVSFDNTSYILGLSNGLENVCNTAVSNWAFSKNTITGHHCTAVGHNSLTNNSTGTFNTAIGADTLESVTTGGYNTAVGGLALNQARSNGGEVAVGYGALRRTSTSSYANVAVGSNALENLNNSDSGANVAVGYSALGGLTNGTGNIAIGYLADNAPQGIGLASNTTSSGNICIGNQATSAGYSNCIAIGQGTFATANNQIIIGSNSNDQTTYIKGSGGLNVTGSATIANTTINKLNNDKAGQIILNKTVYNNNTTAFDATGGVIDNITSANDTYDMNGNNSTAKAIQLKGSDLSFAGADSHANWNRTGNGGHLIIRAGGAFSFGNDGTAPQTLNGGNIYIDSGTAACAGDVGAAVTANPGSIVLRCGQQSSGNTYYPYNYVNKMVIAPTGVSTTVPITIGNTTPPTVYCCLGITTITATLRDGIAIKAAQTNGMDFMQFYNQAGAGIGSITNTGTGTGTSYNTTSDRRLKKDIIQMENILDKIMLLKPCNYNWISNDTPSFGFIAQEVFEIFPKLYNEMPNSDGNIDEPSDKETGKPLHYGLDYGRFTPYIVKAIQETIEIVEKQKKQIDLQQKENEELKSRLSGIEARLAALEM